VKKGVTKTLKEYFEASKSRHLAASKIQAAFRGFQTRKMLKINNKIQLKNNDYVNIKAVNNFLTKHHPVRADELETASTSARHKQFICSDTQQVDVLCKYLSFPLLLRSAGMNSQTCPCLQGLNLYSIYNSFHVCNMLFLLNIKRLETISLTGRKYICYCFLYYKQKLN
jgi:hypothetical protein